MLLSARWDAPRTLQSLDRGRLHSPRQRFYASLQRSDVPLELLVLRGRTSHLGPRGMGVGAPPVHADLLGLVDRADDEADTDGEELDLGQGDADVPGDQEPLVQDAVQDVHEPGGGSVLIERHVRSHAGPPCAARATSADRTSENTPCPRARKDAPNSGRSFARGLNHNRLRLGASRAEILARARALLLSCSWQEDGMGS